MTGKQIDNLNLDLYKEDSKKGLILEVDLEYPDKIHIHKRAYNNLFII